MGKRLAAAVLAMAALLALPASDASAFEEVGNRCVANDSEANWTLIEDSYSSEAALETSSWVNEPGVITRWQVRVAPTMAPLPQKLVVHETLGRNQVRKLAESAVEIVGPGLNEFATRIPVREVNKVGLNGPVETFLCAQQKGILGGAVAGDFPVGEIRSYELKYEVGVPVTAIVEEDKDRDGYGDETQDKCPVSAAYQGECPVVKISASAEAKKKSILVRASVSSEATVDIYGQVGWGFKPSPKLKTAGSKPTRLIIALGSSKRHAAPGKPALLRVPLPKAVLGRLGRLAPDESVTAKLNVVATSLAGEDFAQKLRVRLKGQAGGS